MVDLSHDLRRWRRRSPSIRIRQAQPVESLLAEVCASQRRSTERRDKLTHQDLGQMQMYVNDFDRHVKTADEAPTIGILLCRRKSDALVELTLPEGANIHASEYQLYLPSKEELQKKLMAWTRELEA